VNEGHWKNYFCDNAQIVLKYSNKNEKELIY
jgi:hypothetical protein